MSAYVLPNIRSTKLQDLTLIRLNLLYAHLLRDGRIRGPGGLSLKTVQNVHRMLHRVLRDAVKWSAGLPRIRLHDVRHSYATAALKAGVPAKVVSECLGHSTAAFTLPVYSHVNPGMDEYAKTVAAMILGPGGKDDGT